MQDLTGQKFGRLTVIRLAYKKEENNGYKRPYWLCKCDCGNEKIVNQCKLKSGHTQSCGCLHLENIKEKNSTHKLSQTRIYKIYHDIKKRCNNKSSYNYKNYGGRNIKMCEEWEKDFITFYNWAKNNGYKENLSIDRIDVNGNYSPDNCRWVSMEVQANNKTNSHYITYENKKLTIAQWCRELNIPNWKIHKNIKKYDNDVEALKQCLK